MKNIEFIRKMDSMGRIVIPKDVRKELNIKDEDSLNIILVDDHIEIRKNLYEKTIDKVRQYILNTKDLLNYNIYYFDNNDVYNQEKCSKKIVNAIGERKEYYSSDVENIILKNCEIKGFIGIIPLIKDSELIMTIIIKKDNEFDNKDNLYITILKRFVESL